MGVPSPNCQIHIWDSVPLGPTHTDPIHTNVNAQLLKPYITTNVAGNTYFGSDFLVRILVDPIPMHNPPNILTIPGAKPYYWIFSPAVFGTSTAPRHVAYYAYAVNPVLSNGVVDYWYWVGTAQGIAV